MTRKWPISFAAKKAIVDLCREKAPAATIIVTAIFPRNNGPNFVPTINRVNEEIAKFCDGKKVRYLNVNDKLADKDGKLFEGMMNRDNLHPGVKGYQVWADGLKPNLTELLGQPAPPITPHPNRRPQTPRLQIARAGAAAQ